MKKISIIIPIYNPGRDIVRCLKSLTRQTFMDYELILIDDGSTDNSYELVQKYIDERAVLRERTRVIHQENSGVARTRNRGIELASGKYLAFIDQDDFVAKDYLENLYKAAEGYVHEDGNKGADIVVSGYERVRSDGRIMVKRNLKDEPWAKYTMITPWAHLYRREFIVENDISFLDTKIGEDIYFNVPAYTYTDRIATLQDRGYKWFYNEGSVSNVSHKTLDSKLDVLYLLDTVYDKLETVGANATDDMEYFYIRFICWYLLYSVRGSKRENIIDAYNQIFGWLRSKYPDYRRFRYIGFKMPAGEERSFHRYVFIFYLLEKMHLLLPVLKIFGKK